MMVSTSALFLSFPIKIPIQLAEYRQRKAHADSQKKQKKKKKKKSAEDSDGDLQGQLEAERDRPAGGEDGSGGDPRDGAQTEEGAEEPPTTQFTFSRTLRTGEAVQHDQTYTIEVDTPPAHSPHGFCSSQPRIQCRGCRRHLSENTFTFDAAHAHKNKTGGKKRLLWKQTIAIEEVETSQTSSGSLAALFSQVIECRFIYFVSFSLCFESDPLPHSQQRL